MNNKLQGKDLITIGIYTALYIVARVNPKFCVKSNECRNRAKFICRRQRLDRLPPMSIT